MGAYKEKKALVIGLASSGVAAAQLLAREGAMVDVTDVKPAEALAERIAKLPQGTGLYLGGHGAVPIKEYDLALTSPGVPWDDPFPAAVRMAGIEMISEIELACRHISAPIIAVTGAKGKSTTTTLIGGILEAHGFKVFTGGNLGTPLCGAAGAEYDWIVAEVSSFQLEGIKTFHPKISVVTNVTPDHLDRHKSKEAHAALKARVFENQGMGDSVILNAADPGSGGLAPHPAARAIWFCRKPKAEEGGAWEEDGAVHAKSPGRPALRLFAVKDLLIPCPHNVKNAQAAALAALMAGATAEAIAGAILAFTGLPHRMEYVASAGGINFYNDSKGTSVGAASAALACFDGDVALIAGGSPKDADYAPLAVEIRKRAKGVVLIGQTAPLIEKELGDYQPKKRAGSMAEAVALAASWLTSGGSVLLSPACASFDMFNSAEDRGEAFRRAVALYAKG
jgi:UDP-N-acetylmuramoylalanine--D-glutamate ligase